MSLLVSHMCSGESEMTVEQLSPGTLRIGPFVGTVAQSTQRVETLQRWYDERQGTDPIGYLVAATRDPLSGAYSVAVWLDHESRGRSSDHIVPHPPTGLIS